MSRPFILGEYPLKSAGDDEQNALLVIALLFRVWDKRVPRNPDGTR